MNFVYADESRNLLHLIYAGTLDKAAAKQLLKTVKTERSRLRAGFEVLADIRDLKSIEREAVEDIDELMEFLNERGVGKVVRILRDQTENFGLAIMSVFHYGQDVRFVTCYNLEEAVAALSATRDSANRTPNSTVTD